MASSARFGRSPELHDGGSPSASEVQSVIDELQKSLALLDGSDMTLMSQSQQVRSELSTFIGQLKDHLTNIVQIVNVSLEKFVSDESMELQKRRNLVSSYMLACEAGLMQLRGGRVVNSTIGVAVKNARELITVIRNTGDYSDIKFIPHIQSEINLEDIGYVKYFPIDPGNVDIVMSSVAENQEDFLLRSGITVTVYCGHSTMALINTNFPHLATLEKHLSVRVADFNEKEIVVALDDYQDGSYFAEFTPLSVGVHTLTVRLFGLDVKDSPMKISVIEGAPPSVRSLIESPGCLNVSDVSSAFEDLEKATGGLSLGDVRVPVGGRVVEGVSQVSPLSQLRVVTAVSGRSTPFSGESLLCNPKGIKPAGLMEKTTAGPLSRQRHISSTSGHSTGRSYLQEETWDTGSTVNAVEKQDEQSFDGGTKVSQKILASSLPVKGDDSCSGAGISGNCGMERNKVCSSGRGLVGGGGNVGVGKEAFSSGSGFSGGSGTVGVGKESFPSGKGRGRVGGLDSCGDSAIRGTAVPLVPPVSSQMPSDNGDSHPSCPIEPANANQNSQAVVSSSNSKTSILQEYIDKKIDKVQTVFLASIGCLGNGPESLSMPIGVTFSSLNDVIVCDTRHNLVKIFSKDGKCKQIIRNAGKKGFARPSAAVVNEHDEIYVKDDVAVHVFDFTGTEHFMSIGEGIVKRPYGLAFNSKGNLMMFDQCRPTPLLFEFNETGEMVSKSVFEPLLDTSTQMGSKCRFMTCTDQHVFVVDLGRSVVYKTDYNGKTVKVFGQMGRKLGDFNEPSGISADCNGNLLIADSKNNRIQVFDSEGKVWGVVQLAHNIVRPSDIHLTQDGLLLVSNYLKNCVKIFRIQPPSV